MSATAASVKEGPNFRSLTLITNWEVLEVVGSGLVVIVDGKGISYTNLNTVCRNTPITVHGIQMHILGPGEKCLLRERAELQRL